MFFDGEKVVNNVNENKRVPFHTVFSKQPEEGKKKFATGIGKKYSNFRRGIMLTAIRALQKDRLHIFEPSDQDADEADVARLDVNDRSTLSCVLPDHHVQKNLAAF